MIWRSRRFFEEQQFSARIAYIRLINNNNNQSDQSYIQ